MTPPRMQKQNHFIPGVTSQSSSSKTGTSIRPFPPFEGIGSPSSGRSSTFQTFSVPVPWNSAFTEANFRSATIPGFPTPVSCPSPLPAPGARGSGKMADGDGLGEAATAAASPPAPAPGLSPPLGWRERLRAGLAGTGASLWFVAGLGLLYALRVPLRLCENLAAGERPRPPRGRAGGQETCRGRGLKAGDAVVPGGPRRVSLGCATEWVLFLLGRDAAADCQPERQPPAPP